ncbi:LysE family transporter [Marinobacteraceae bacterium S3BR75-40.1]
MVQSYLTGIAVCAAIIVAIGAQNAFVLAQGLRRSHHLTVALLCALCDAVLFGLGLAGVAKAIAALPELQLALRVGGGLVLLAYAGASAWRAWQGSGRLQRSDGTQASAGVVIAACLGVTLLNPQVYLDTFVLIPMIGLEQVSPLWFWAGATSASLMWFLLLSLGAAALAPKLEGPRAWQWIDGSFAFVMGVIGVDLLLG